jgi:hypothetical protein
MEDTSGFFKVVNGELWQAANYVKSPTTELFRDKKDEYEYPVDGWFWLDSEEEARLFFNLPKTEESNLI